jgi:hypothetical protein
MPLSTISVAKLLLLFFISPTNATGFSQSSTTEALHDVNLRAAIGNPPVAFAANLPPLVSLWFLDDKTLVYTFVTRESASALLKHDVPNSDSSLRLVAVFLDASTGKITDSHSWPTSSAVAKIVATYDGKFLTQRGATLPQYSRDGNELKTLQLPADQNGTWGWGAHPSPSGQNILLTSPNLKSNSAVPWVWVDAKNLRVVRSWEEVQSGWVGISDRSIVMTSCAIWFYHCDPHVSIRDLVNDWTAIAPLEKSALTHDSFTQTYFLLQSSPLFVNDQVFFLPGGGRTKVFETESQAAIGKAGTLRSMHMVEQP